MFISRLGTSPDPGKDYLVCLHGEDGEWRFPPSKRAAWLYEDLPAAFGFEEVLEAGEKRGMTGEEAVRCLREWQALEMVTTMGDSFKKNPDERPYFSEELRCPCTGPREFNMPADESLGSEKATNLLLTVFEWLYDERLREVDDAGYREALRGFKDELIHTLRSELAALEIIDSTTISETDAASLFGVSRRTLKRMTDAGEIPCGYRGRERRYSLAQIRRVMREIGRGRVVRTA